MPAISGLYDPLKLPRSTGAQIGQARAKKDTQIIKAAYSGKWVLLSVEFDDFSFE